MNRPASLRPDLRSPEANRQRFRLFDDESLENLVLNHQLSESLRREINNELVRRKKERETGSTLAG